MLLSVERRSRPTKLGREDQFTNRRLVEEESEYIEHLQTIRETGYTILKPPGVKKTMAVLAQEAQERSVAQASSTDFDQGFDHGIDHSYISRIPDASLNHSLVLEEQRSSFASWNTFDESEVSNIPPHYSSTAPILPRSPTINFSRMRDRDLSDQSIYHDSIYHDTIYIRQDSSFR